MDSWELWSTRFSYTAQGGSAWKRLLTVAWWNEWRSGGRCCVLRRASKQHSGTKECHYEDYSSATWSADQPHHRPTKGHLKRLKTETVQQSHLSGACGAAVALVITDARWQRPWAPGARGANHHRCRIEWIRWKSTWRQRPHFFDSRYSRTIHLKKTCSKSYSPVFHYKLMSADQLYWVPGYDQQSGEIVQPEIQHTQLPSSSSTPSCWLLELKRWMQQEVSQLQQYHNYRPTDNDCKEQNNLCNLQQTDTQWCHANTRKRSVVHCCVISNIWYVRKIMSQYVPYMFHICWQETFVTYQCQWPSDKDRVIMPSGTTRTHASVAAANCRSQAGSAIHGNTLTESFVRVKMHRFTSERKVSKARGVWVNWWIAFWVSCTWCLHGMLCDMPVNGMEILYNIYIYTMCVCVCLQSWRPYLRQFYCISLEGLQTECPKGHHAGSEGS